MASEKNHRQGSFPMPRKRNFKFIGEHYVWPSLPWWSSSPFIGGDVHLADGDCLVYHGNCASCAKEGRHVEAAAWESQLQEIDISFCLSNTLSCIMHFLLIVLLVCDVTCIFSNQYQVITKTFKTIQTFITFRAFITFVRWLNYIQNTKLG